MIEVLLACIGLVGVGAVLTTAMAMQQRHYQFKSDTSSAAEFAKLASDLKKELHDFHEYKKKVDALVLKAGFKL